MGNKYQKIAILSLLLISLLVSFGFVFGQRELEVGYPEIGGLRPETTETLLPDYVKYIFNFAIAIIGLIAFGILVWSGIEYFTSAGRPDVLRAAKDRIKSAFGGILILLLSYLILITINPQLVIFQLPGIPVTPPAELPETPISPFIASDLLRRIKEMAETIKQIPDEIKKTAEKIEDLTADCECENTQSLCICEGGSETAQCQPRYCYAGLGSHPCPDSRKIKNNQRKIIAWRDEILYYGNRALVEAEDLKDDTETILGEKISWYNQKIAAEEEVLEKLEEQSAKELQQMLIDFLKEGKEWLEEEKRYKEELIQKLKELAKAIEKVKEPTTKIPILASQCLSNVKERCLATCKPTLPHVPGCSPGSPAESTYGCHDAIDGCQPDTCQGGNPCPINEIQDEVGKINPSEINSICNEIISIIDSIAETKQRRIQF